eukprot:6845131-Lingulodinium_polyedra.AAC.1
MSNETPLNGTRASFEKHAGIRYHTATTQQLATQPNAMQVNAMQCNTVTLHAARSYVFEWLKLGCKRAAIESAMCTSIR